MPQAIKTETFDYVFDDVKDYINWIYFFHSWQFPPAYAAIADLGTGDEARGRWLASLPEGDAERGKAAITLYDEAMRVIADDGGRSRVRFRYALYAANSDGDDIVLRDGRRIPFLRQQLPGKDGYCLCLADYLSPAGSGTEDTLGVFAATIASGMGRDDTDGDAYCHFMSQTLAERMVEAAVEKSHQRVRREGWGYAHGERLSRQELLAERYQGIRPAVGYPSIPDQSINFIIDELLDLGSVGIALTDNGAMSPAASVDGFMFANANSRYFNIGDITDEQLHDYAARRGMDTASVRKFLARYTI